MSSSILINSFIEFPAAGGSFLLDDLGISATIAVGLRKLKSAYAGSCLRARRVSDDAEQDIGFSSDVLDWAAAIAFMGGSSLRVVTWYDQSGNARHMDANATAAAQPVLDTSAEIIDFDGSDDFLWKTGVDLSATAGITMIGAGKFSALISGDVFMSVHDGGTNIAKLNTDGTYLIGQQNDGSGVNGLYETGNTSDHVFSMVCDRSLAAAAETKVYLDGTIFGNVYVATELSANFDNSNWVSVGSEAGSNIGDVQAYEFILFPVALNSTDRGTAEVDIAAAYSI